MPDRERRSSRSGSIILDQDEAAKAALEAEQRLRNQWVIRPAKENPKLRYWQTLIGVALLFVCFVTPFEVALLEPEMNALFIANRCIDALFLWDMILQFFVMQEIKHRYGVSYIFDHRKLVRTYVRSWFALDLFSVLPFDILGLVFKSDDMSRLKVLRTIRLLRLLKLFRLLRGMRLLKAWQSSNSFSNRKMTLFNVSLSVLVAAHWMACSLGGLSSIQGDEDCLDVDEETSECVQTWLVNTGRTGRSTSFGVFLIAIHTASTILVHPHSFLPTNSSERICMTLLVFFGGWVWTEVISRSTAIIFSIDRHNIAYHQSMDDLNSIATELKISHGLQRRLRRFCINTPDVSQRKTWGELIKRVSPALRKEVAREQNRAWIRCVQFIATCSSEFKVDISQNLLAQMFGQSETFGAPFNMYILNRGLAVRQKGFFIRQPGAVWGEEHLLLTAWWLLTPTTTLAMTFVEVLALERQTFVELAQEHPQDAVQLRRSYIKLALRHGLLHLVRARRQATTGQVTEQVALHDGQVVRQIQRAMHRGVKTIETNQAAVDSLTAQSPRAMMPSWQGPRTDSERDATKHRASTQTGLTDTAANTDMLFFWAAIEERLEQHVSQLHQRLQGRMTQQASQFERMVLEHGHKFEEMMKHQDSELLNRLHVGTNALPTNARSAAAEAPPGGSAFATCSISTRGEPVSLCRGSVA